MRTTNPDLFGTIRQALFINNSQLHYSLYFCLRMKRLLVVILSLVYFAASSGFTLRQHYCMGEYIGTAIDHPAGIGETHQCGRCGMEKKSDGNGCCQDKVKTFQASPDQLPVKALQAPSVAAVAVLPAGFVLPRAQHLAMPPRIAAAPAQGPPGKIGALPLYLQVRSLRL
jgi:hypothetical protein